MAALFANLSNESQRRRFFSLTQTAADLIACDDSNPSERLSLVVLRGHGTAARIIATGQYAPLDATTAEVALAVEDRFQGKGIGSLLLERLALIAVQHGFRRFCAVTTPENRAMHEVFRESGFECSSRADDGYVEIDLSVLPSQASVARAEFRDRVATTASLRPFFQPSSIAIVGVSRNPANIGTRILKAVVSAGFKGPVYPVNPNAELVQSLKAYASIRDLPEAADLAVIAVPAAAVEAVIDDCAARGVRAAIVISAGFAELGGTGRERQLRLLEKVRGYGMRMVGPNCLGLMNTDPRAPLNASFAPEFPPAGNVAFCSQSGALGLAIIAQTRARRLGISYFISVGNKADVSGNDLLQYWEEDNRTAVILLYLESFGNARRFARIAKRVGRRKPIIAVKAGRSGAGRRAAGSHTAALAADDVAVEALFHQTGVIRANTVGEMFDLAMVSSTQPLPKGKRVAILTNAGGLGILCADACEANGLTVQELSAETRKQLQQFLPATASLANPVDMIASATADHFHNAAAILITAAEVDALIALTIDVGITDANAIARAVENGVRAARHKHNLAKPVLTCFIGAAGPLDGDASGGTELPNFSDPESAARTLGKLAVYAEWRERPEGTIPEFDDLRLDEARSACDTALRANGPGWLSGGETREILKAFSMPIAPGAICRTADQAASAARQIGFPVALKLTSRTIVHKTEFDAVRLGLTDEAAVRQAFDSVCQSLDRAGKLAEIDGVLVQPMISGGVELMIGVTQDPLFGPLIGFGLGGIHVEILKDVSFRVTPITDIDAAEMVRSIRGYRLLQGYRGHPPADIHAVEDLLLRVARLVEELPQITELDLNPIIVFPPGRGCQIVDARLRIAPTVR
jgi:acetyl coenzyme A synthetase (ADP forming)-like protein